MPYLKPERPEKVSAPSLRSSKQRGERLVCLTAYDYPTARIFDEAGIDIILVGDSLGNVVLGYGNTVPVTLESRMTEVGTIELWCVARDQAQRWKLELSIREPDAD